MRWLCWFLSNAAAEASLRIVELLVLIAIVGIALGIARGAFAIPTAIEARSAAPLQTVVRSPGVLAPVERVREDVGAPLSTFEPWTPGPPPEVRPPIPEPASGLLLLVGLVLVAAFRRLQFARRHPIA